MIASTRHRIYAISIVGLVLALWLRPASETTATVMPARSAARSPASSAPSAAADGRMAAATSTQSASRGVNAVGDAAPMLAERSGRMPDNLFAAPPPPTPQVPVVEVVAEPVFVAPDLQMLGWLQSGQVHWVSVMSNNTSYTLQPGEQVEEHYRYEGVRDGMAVFTSLRDGTSREYPISDVTTTDQD